MTLLNIFFIIIGVVLVIWGADRLTEGAASLARGLRVPEIVIGLTILAAGTIAASTYISTQNATNSNSNPTSKTYGANNSYLLDYNYALAQAEAQVRQEYLQAKKFRPDLTYEQFMMEKAQANQAAQMEEQNNSTMGSNNTTNSVIQKSNKHNCSLCHGTGRIAEDSNPGQFGMDNNYKIRCNECGEMVLKSSRHFHKPCPI